MATSRQKAETKTSKTSAKTADARRTANTNDATKVVQHATDQLKTLAQSGRVAAQKQLEAGLSMTSENMERVTTNMMKNLDEMTGWNKDMFDAYVSYCTTWAKGCEEISKTWMSTYQTAAQQYMQTCKSMLTAKTMKEAMDTQSDFARSQFDTMMAEGTKMSELCVKLASEASEPLQTQWTTLTSKMSQAA